MVRPAPQSDASQAHDNVRLNRLGRIVGSSPAMQHVYAMITRVASTDATVLLTGESGTGKELVARTIHDYSPRRHHAFVAVNCGAIPEGVAESELFGHERGSFTGASGRHHGYFERANNGTIFLDEITEMPLDMQVSLLRVLEMGCVLRVGGQQELPVNVRVIAASNQSPARAVREGVLREDLLYRLSVFPLHLPPLRERPMDACVLADYFLTLLNAEASKDLQLTSESLRRIAQYPWPGNVRELENCIRRAFILSDSVIDLHLPPPHPHTDAPAERDGHAAPATGQQRELTVSIGTSLADMEKRLILATLEHYAGDKRAAAQVLGVSLKTLYNKLHLYEQASDSR